MTKRREPDRAWSRLAANLRPLAASGPLSLSDAQRLFDSAPDVPLSADQTRAIVSVALARLVRGGERELTDVRERPFTFEFILGDEATVVPWDLLVVTNSGNLSGDWITEINSLSVDTRRVSGARILGGGAVGATTDPVSWDVVARSESRDRALAGRLQQGIVRWDAYLDAAGVESRHVEMVCSSGWGASLRDENGTEIFFGN
jgi:hypothetical protein